MGVSSLKLFFCPSIRSHLISCAPCLLAAGPGTSGFSCGRFFEQANPVLPREWSAWAKRGRRFQRGLKKTMLVSAADEVGGDAHEVMVDLHRKMPSDGMKERLETPSRETHNQRQAAAFDSRVEIFASPDATPPQVVPSMKRIAGASRPDEERARVVDVGCGTGSLVPFLKEAGVAEERIVGVDLSPEMAAVFRDRFPEAQLVVADFVNVAQELPRQTRPAPAADGEDGDDVKAEEESGGRAPFGTVIFNAMFGNLWDQRVALESAAEILQEAGKAVISHPLGRDFVTRLKKVDGTVVPHDLPLEDELRDMIRFLPLQVQTFESAEGLYLAVMKKTPHRASDVVRYLRGEVFTPVQLDEFAKLGMETVRSQMRVAWATLLSTTAVSRNPESVYFWKGMTNQVSRGYGRGSKKLGVPTANLPESLFAENLEALATGVYFGWALLEQGSGDETSEGPWKCVANIGYSPTFAGQENAQKIVEAHLIGYEGGDFYGKTMRLALVGFQRFERKFGSFPELITTINKDVRDAAVALEEPRFAAFRTDPFFSLGGHGGSDGSSGAGDDPPGSWSTRDFVSAMEAATLG